MTKDKLELQLTINQLEKLITLAKENQKRDSSLSNTINIQVLSTPETHLGCSKITARINSAYAECIGKLLI
jgi:hypothetical protein